MKRYKLFIPFVAILCLCIACTKETEEPEIPQDWQANLKIEIVLSSNGNNSTSTINGEVVSELNYNMGNISNLVYIVHALDDERFLKFYSLSQTDIQEFVKDGVAILEDKLPFGRYYVSLIVTAEDKLENSLLKGLSEKYSKAACQVPNNHIFYNSIEVDCSHPEGKEVKEDILFVTQVELSLLTGEFIFLLPPGSKKIPPGANFSMEAEIRDLPAAFFLKSRKTLTNEEVALVGMKKYNRITEITTPFESQLVAKYYLLSNGELEDTEQERGYFEFTYKENADSEDVTRFISCKMPAWKSETNAFFSYIWMSDLYSERSEELQSQ
ncbi:MAG: hypothetical protein LUE98_09830 [Tannerellaceae bacterium]|nr:hypothetical protein [Tannerellaceae bacterium]